MHLDRRVGPVPHRRPAHSPLGAQLAEGISSLTAASGGGDDPPRLPLQMGGSPQSAPEEMVDHVRPSLLLDAERELPPLLGIGLALARDHLAQVLAGGMPSISWRRVSEPEGLGRLPRCSTAWSLARAAGRWPGAGADRPAGRWPG